MPSHDVTDPAAGEPTAAQAKQAPKRAAAIPPRFYRVLKTKVVSIDSRMTTLTEGAVLDIRGYGPDGIRKLIEQGAQLEAVADRAA